jgi:hypothetical protein
MTPVLNKTLSLHARKTRERACRLVTDRSRNGPANSTQMQGRGRVFALPLRPEAAMRVFTTVIALIAAALCLSLPSQADESNKLTYVTFNKPVQLPGVTLPAGRYRFELADVVESRRVIKVQSEDGKKQLAMLLTVPNQLREIPKDPVVLFRETAQGQPEAVRSYNYPGERTGYELIYSHAEAMVIAHRTHTPVLAKHGDKIERVDESGNKAENEELKN